MAPPTAGTFLYAPYIHQVFTYRSLPEENKSVSKISLVIKISRFKIVSQPIASTRRKTRDRMTIETGSDFAQNKQTMRQSDASSKQLHGFNLRWGDSSDSLKHDCIWSAVRHDQQSRRQTRSELKAVISQWTGIWSCDCFVYFSQKRFSHESVWNELPPFPENCPRWTCQISGIVRIPGSAPNLQTLCFCFRAGTLWPTFMWLSSQQEFCLFKTRKSKWRVKCLCHETDGFFSSFRLSTWPKARTILISRASAWKNLTALSSVSVTFQSISRLVLLFCFKIRSVLQGAVSSFAAFGKGASCRPKTVVQAPVVSRATRPLFYPPPIDATASQPSTKYIRTKVKSLPGICHPLLTCHPPTDVPPPPTLRSHPLSHSAWWWQQ